MTLRGSRTVLSAALFALIVALPGAGCAQASAPPDDERVRGTFPALEVTTPVSQMSIPWDVQQLPSGQLLITERSTKKLWIKDGSGRHEVDFPNGNIWASGETGLMGLELNPTFGRNRLFYTCHGRTLSGGRHDIAVVAWRLSQNRQSATRVKTLLGGIKVTSGRHGGCRLLALRNGSMYVGTGDAAVGTHPQNKRTLNGKVLRLETKTGNPWPGNPWINATNKNKRYLVNYGHRNIQGLARRADGTIWSIEHGSYRDDEVNLVEEKGNYGWDPVPNDGGDPSYNEEVEMTDLVKFPNAIEAKWSSGDPTVATSGGVFVRGEQWGEYDGMLAVACLAGSQVMFIRFDEDGNQVGEVRIPSVLEGDRVRSISRANNGDLLITTANGFDDRILRVSPVS